MIWEIVVQLSLYFGAAFFVHFMPAALDHHIKRMVNVYEEHARAPFVVWNCILAMYCTEYWIEH